MLSIFGMITIFVKKYVMKSINEKVKSIIVTVLNINDQSADNLFLKKKIREWDSLKHIVLITNIEDEFDILFEPEEISEMLNYFNIVNMIEKKLKKQ